MYRGGKSWYLEKEMLPAGALWSGTSHRSALMHGFPTFLQQNPEGDTLQEKFFRSDAEVSPVNGGSIGSSRLVCLSKISRRMRGDAQLIWNVSQRHAMLLHRLLPFLQIAGPFGQCAYCR